MTDDNCPRLSSSQSDPSTTKQRKRRKWDQPDESLISANVLASGIALPVVSTVSRASVAPFATSSTTSFQSVQVPLQQHATAIVQNLVQSRIQDELISREIVINDADSSIRYKLTRRQMQEEIQMCTSALVITRGKYRPPNAPPDGERPLYLHISAASHLEATAERVKAVDQAAAMVEEILKQGSLSSGIKVDHLSSTRIFLGFEADPSLNIASRIRGPNDQYINHIMNKTGATVLLRGRGSGHSQNEPSEDSEQSLHLLLSSDDPKSLECARVLAENLLDTITAECGASRVSSCNSYAAVPPLSHLESGSQNSLNTPTSSLAALGGVSIVGNECSTSQSIGVSIPGLPQANTGCYPSSSFINGTSYVGYGGIYPQATPLQQVALALRQSASPVPSTIAATTAANHCPRLLVPTSLTERRSEKRKFKELPSAAGGPASINQKNFQGSDFPMPRELTSHVGVSNVSTVPQPSEKIVMPSFTGMPPPPPPPKFNSTTKLHGNSPSLPKFDSVPDPIGSNTVVLNSKPEAVPDTLIKLMEYGDDEDEDDEDLDATTHNTLNSHSSLSKPFWAI